MPKLSVTFENMNIYKSLRLINIEENRWEFNSNCYGMNRQSQVVCEPENTCSVSEPFQTSMNHYVAPKRMTFKDKGALVRSVSHCFHPYNKSRRGPKPSSFKKKKYMTRSVYVLHTLDDLAHSTKV